MIFDCDGVLVDSEGVSTDALTRAIGEAGLARAAGMRVLGYASDGDAGAVRDAGAELVFDMREVLDRILTAAAIGCSVRAASRDRRAGIVGRRRWRSSSHRRS